MSSSSKDPTGSPRRRRRSPGLASLLNPVAQPGREVFYQATSFDAVTGAATALSSYNQGSVL